MIHKIKSIQGKTPLVIDSEHQEGAAIKIPFVGFIIERTRCSKEPQCELWSGSLSTRFLIVLRAISEEPDRFHEDSELVILNGFLIMNGDRIILSTNGILSG